MLLHASRLLPSASQCKPSPDGKLIACLDAATITIRSTETLQTTAVVKLPKEFSGPVVVFEWSLSSFKILVASLEQIHVFSATDTPFEAAIRTPVVGSGKLSTVRFGAMDTDILVFSSMGLKLIIFDLCTSTAIDIANPKYYLSTSATRTFSLRPQTGHLALLTRSNGKDIISLHDPVNKQVQKSWNADSVDAQALQWTPDGNWLLLWDAPAQGHRILIYTADGQHFRTLNALDITRNEDAELAAGIRLCETSPNSKWLAVGDYSRNVMLLETSLWRPSMTLKHPGTINPRDTLQVWQEQFGSSADGQPTCSFLRATQSVAPPSLSASEFKSGTDLKQGCSLVAFDASSSLLATKLDDAPCTLWIWDVASAELRAVLIFHSAIDMAWHPTIKESLLITCQDESRPGVFYEWDPLSEGPKTILSHDYLPRKNMFDAKERTEIHWVNDGSDAATLLISNTQNCRLLSTAEAESNLDRWRYDAQLTSEPESWQNEEVSTLTGDDGNLPDNTFSFKTS